MRLTLVGCGDAFGSGGRANTCFFVESRGGGDRARFRRHLARRAEAARDRPQPHRRGDAVATSTATISAACRSSSSTPSSTGHRDKPLTVVGPVGTGERVRAAMEVFFPGSSGNRWKFALNIVDLPSARTTSMPTFASARPRWSTPRARPRPPCGSPTGASTLVYSGDTSWTEALVEAARGADLFITECYTALGAPVAHLSLEDDRRQPLPLRARRIMLTHMSAAVLRQARRDRGARLSPGA